MNDRRRQWEYRRSFQDKLVQGRHVSSVIEDAMFEANLRSGGEYQAKTSGDYGEYSISSIMNALPDHYNVMNDIILKTKKGTTQLDHVIVSPFGVFVVETKNHKGMIFGDGVGKVWTQVLPGRGHFTLYSPVLQNRGHIINLCRAIRIPENIVAGVIVFTNPTTNLDNARPWAMNPEEAYRYILSFTNPILSDKIVNKIIDRIDQVNISGYRKQKEHVQYVKSIQQQAELRRQARRMRGF